MSLSTPSEFSFDVEEMSDSQAISFSQISSFSFGEVDAGERAVTDVPVPEEYVTPSLANSVNPHDVQRFVEVGAYTAPDQNVGLDLANTFPVVLDGNLTNVVYQLQGHPQHYEEETMPMEDMKINMYPSHPISEIAHNSNLLLNVPMGGNSNTLSLSQSSSSSVDDSVPSMESWAGPYNFGFCFETGPSRKYAFSKANNKLFIGHSTPVEFFFKWDYDACTSPSDLFLSAFMRYTKPDCASAPVLRCDSHEAEESRKIRETNLPESQSQEFLDRVVHVMRCVNTNVKVEYMQDKKTNRCSLRMPLKKPQAGEHKVGRFFQFECLNSCKPPPVLKKSPTAVVFELLERVRRHDRVKYQVKGRIAFDIRVCTCPMRDFTKEEPKHTNDDFVSSLTRMKRKSEAGSAHSSPAGESPRENKRPRKSPLLRETRGSGIILGADSKFEEDIERAAKSRRLSDVGMSTPKSASREDIPPIPEVDLGSQTSSQESNASDLTFLMDDDSEEKRQKKKQRYRDDFKIFRWLAKLSLDPKYREIGRTMSSNLRHMAKLARSMVAAKESQDPQAVACIRAPGMSHELNGSPDSGVGLITPQKKQE